jgi:hypothetical protein
MSMSANREFRIGEVIGKGFQVLFRNFGAFAVISLLVTLPALLFELAVMDDMAALETASPEQAHAAAGNVLLYSFVAIVIQVIAGGIAAGALTYGALQDLRGRKAGFGECLGRGLALILPVLGVSIVAGLGMAIGFLFFFIPGIILAVMWWVAVPAMVVERPGVFASLKRSAALTKGSRWRIFGLMLIVGGVVILIPFLVEFLIATALGMAISTFLSWLVNAFITSFSAVLAAVGYYHLRTVREGVEIDEIAKVFD